jgi:DNA-binding Lrp family transcriptional regulator
VQITVDPKRGDAVVAALQAIPEVRRLETVSGAYDLVAVVAALSTAEVDAVLDRIGRVEGIERTTSAIVLSTKIDR